MHIDPWILSFSAVTVLATIFMGFWSARRSKTASDFFVAGRSVSVGWNASAISGEYLSAASFMGVAGMVMSSGYDALWYPVCYACGYLFLLLFIAGPLRRFGAYTIPDFAEGRFDSPVFRKIAVVFVLFIGFFYTMPQMKGAGTTLAYIFPGLPYWVGVALVGAVITLNVALGGMKGITLVQAVQYWAKMFAISVPIFVLMAVYGNYGKQLELQNAPAPVSAQALLNLPTQPNYVLKNSGPYSTILNSVGEALQMYARVTGQDVLPKQPALLRRLDEELSGRLTAWGILPSLSISGLSTNRIAYRVPSGGSIYESDVAHELELAFKTNGIGFLLIAEKRLQAVAVDAFTNNVPFTMRALLPDKAPSDSSWLSPFGPLTTKAAKAAKLSPEESKPYSLLYTYSLIIALVCGTAGLPHILVRFYTNPDGVAAKRTTMWVMILIGIFYVFPPVFGVLGRNLMPELYTGLSGIKGTDQVVLKLPTILGEKYGVLGSILSGITCAGAFAAFMSTFSGLLVSMTGALAHDVYGRMLKPNATADERTRMFKFGAVLLGGMAIVLGSFVEALEINFMVGQAFAIAAASYFPLLFMAVWWRRLTMKGAAVGMLSGGVAALLAVTLTNLSTLSLDPGPMGKVFSVFKPLNGFWAGHPLLRILCEQPAIWCVPLAIGLMIVISKLTASQVPSDIRMKMLVLHAPEKLGLKQDYIQEHQHGH
ncbi:MAG: cation acetate symporter [Pedosphaera sp.]|nr:cation acetate symporter [Pedosphaera sp.]